MTNIRAVGGRLISRARISIFQNASKNLIGKRTMKYVTRTLMGIVLLIGAAVLVAHWRALRAREADDAYHTRLVQTLVVSSKSFAADGPIPAMFTCHGQGLSPQLGWEGGSPNAKSYVLLMVDWDAPAPWLPLNAFTHWALFNIPSSDTAVAEATTATQLRQNTIDVARNSSDADEYVPPCPPVGRHHYTFRVYALDLARLRPRSDDRSGVLEAMRGHVVGYGQIVGVSGG